MCASVSRYDERRMSLQCCASAELSTVSAPGLCHVLQLLSRPVVCSNWKFFSNFDVHTSSRMLPQPVHTSKSKWDDSDDSDDDAGPAITSASRTLVSGKQVQGGTGRVLILQCNSFVSIFVQICGETAV